MPEAEQPAKSNTDIFPGNGSGDDDPHGNWQDSQMVPNHSMEDIAAMAGYVARQTNPYTGAPLPQPTVGQGSANTPAVPPPPGQTTTGG